MKRYLCIGLMLIAVQSFAQNQGINFFEATSWEQIVNKARSENKYIFLDCYATWCGPCKEMDRTIYIADSVGSFFNQHFISVKLQLDTNAADNESIKKLYSTSKNLMKEFSISALPSYLFFSPEGLIVDRDKGLQDINSFIKIGQNALNPDRQVYVLIRDYQKDKLKYARYSELAELVGNKIGDRTIEDEIIKAFITKHLNKLSKNELLTKQNLSFFERYYYEIELSDRYFNLIHTNTDLVDRIVGVPGYAKRVSKKVIANSLVYPSLRSKKVWADRMPNWDSLSKVVRNAYGKYYADLIILESKCIWYAHTKENQKRIPLEIYKIEKYGVDTTGPFGKFFSTNNLMYNLIFKHSNDPVILEKAARIVESMVKQAPTDGNMIDTYANLLYKLNRRSEALEWEERAVKISNDEEVRLNFKKMKKGEPTW